MGIHLNVPTQLDAPNIMEWRHDEVYEENAANRACIVYETQNDCVEIISNLNHHPSKGMGFELKFTVWSDDMEELLARAAKIMNGDSDTLHIITGENTNVTAIKT